MSQSKRLNPDEDQVLIDRLIQLFKRTDETHPIFADQIIKFFNKKIDDGKLNINGRMTDIKLRKCINHIRKHSLLPIISNSKGYYMSSDVQVISNMITSLESRCESIKQAADGLRLILNKKVKSIDKLGIEW